MTNYILRRLLLMVPTLLGISIICFVLFQFVPGGPVEQIINRMKRAGGNHGMVSERMTEEEINNIRAYLEFDKPAYIRYIHWLKKACTGDLGSSYIYKEPVLQVIASKFPLSLFFGLTSFIISYLVSIPLGVHKALNHGKFSDVSTTAVVYAGFVMPSYAFGILLIIFFAGGSYFNWFPVGNMVSDNFDHLTFWGKVGDFLHHMVLPLLCYLIGEFAFLVQLMKNSVMDELGKDYVRTALAKGLSFKQAVWRQAFRNSLIPIATGIGAIFTILFTGAVLIERVFDLDGMGMLFYNSILNQDYNVVLGIIVLSSLLMMLGRLFSDLLYVVIDPRIRFT